MMSMRVGYVVLYVTDAQVCRQFWIEQVGMVEKDRKEVGDFVVVQVGFADQPFAFELVPLANGVTAMEIGEHGGVRSFAFSDPEGRWFAVTA
jgi:catechol 2,3-dioxygenase-like lactoylglutathione lyase family enzyme